MIKIAMAINAPRICAVVVITSFMLKLYADCLEEEDDDEDDDEEEDDEEEDDDATAASSSPYTICPLLCCTPSLYAFIELSSSYHPACWRQ